MTAPKIVNDPVLGHISLSPLQVAIIDTPEFQRLRDIKRLGVVHLVYPGAVHTQFDHSIGVSHLAGELVERLKFEQSDELNLQPFHVRCLKVASLCYALGSGPYNKLFDEYFANKKNEIWQRSTVSARMFQHLVEKNHLECECSTDNHPCERKLCSSESILIEKLITYDITKTVPQEYRNFTFLFEILHNHETGVDVKMWDSLARDAYHVGIKNSFDYRRFMPFIRILNQHPISKHADQEIIQKISFRDKEVEDVFEMLHTHHRLHRLAYKHKTCIAIEMKYGEALEEAAQSNNLLFESKRGVDGAPVKKNLDQIVKDMDMEAYSKVTDFIWYQMQHLPEPNKARDIMVAIVKRHVPKFIGETFVNEKEREEDTNRLIKNLGDQIFNRLKKESVFTAKNILYQKVEYKFNRAQDGGNMLENMFFYTKAHQDVPVKIATDQVSRLFPTSWQETTIIVCFEPPNYEDFKEVEKYRTDIRNSFMGWCKEKNLPAPKNDGHTFQLHAVQFAKLDE